MATTTVKLISQVGVAQVTTANTNLDGTGALVSLFVGAGTYGSAITSITVKATGNTTPGMVRIFLRDLSSNTYLLEEFRVYPNDLNSNYGIVESYSSTLVFPMGTFKVAAGWTLFASTQNSETFNVIAEGYDQDYCPC